MLEQIIDTYVRYGIAPDAGAAHAAASNMHARAALPYLRKSLAASSS